MTEYDSRITLKQLHVTAQFSQPPLKTEFLRPQTLSNLGIFLTPQIILIIVSQVAALNNSIVLPTPLLAVLTREAAPRVGSLWKTMVLGLFPAYPGHAISGGESRPYLLPSTCH